MVTDIIAVRLSRTEIAIELIASELANLVTTWEVCDAATGDVKCSMDTRMKALGCVDVKAARGRNNYAIYGIWWADGTAPPDAVNGIVVTSTRRFHVNATQRFHASIH